MPGDIETRKQMMEREAKKFNELIESYRHRCSYDCDSTIRESTELNPNGYNIGQIIGISKGNGRMFSKKD